MPVIETKVSARAVGPWHSLQLKFSQRRHIVKTVGASKRHVPELDGIRGWACASVLLAHVLIGIFTPAAGALCQGIQLHTIDLLLAGVDLFFVLSGFLIGGILIDAKGESHFFKRFWIRRIARILPVLWLLLTSYAMALFVRAHANLPQMDLWLLAEPKPPFWTYATFTQSLPIALGGYGGPRWVGITWSLAIEEQFYLFFPFAVYFFSRRSLLITVLAGICFAPVLRDWWSHLFGSWYAPYVLMPSRVDGLMYGVLVAMIIRNSKALVVATKWRYALDALALVIIFSLCTQGALLDIWHSTQCGPYPPLKQSFIAILAAIVILRLFTYQQNAFNRLWLAKPLAWLGAISYGLYMYHQSINGMVHGFIFNQEPKVASLAEFGASIFVMASATAMATVSYLFIEKPIRKYGHRYSLKFPSTFLQEKGSGNKGARATDVVG